MSAQRKQWLARGILGALMLSPLAFAYAMAGWLGVVTIVLWAAMTAALIWARETLGPIPRPSHRRPPRERT